MEKVADVLKCRYPQFNTAAPDCLVSDALYQMVSANYDYLIVMDAGGFQGVLSEHDIAAKVLFDDRPLREIRVSEFTNRTLPVATEEDTPEYCLQLLEQFGARYLAVYDRFTFKGVLSSQDLVFGTLHAEEGKPARVNWSDAHWAY